MARNYSLLDRREFLMEAAATACFAMLPRKGMAAAAKEEIPILSGYQPAVSAIWVPKGEHEKAFDLFKKMIESATDFSWLSKGDSVFLKLALNSGNPYPATTDPWQLWAMVKILKERGAGKILIGDQSGAEHVHWTAKDKKGSSRELCKTAGLLKIVEENGVEPCFYEERGYEAYFPTLPSGIHHWNKPILLPNVLKEAQHLIFLPRVSSHTLSDATLGMKVAVGFLREDSRREFHEGGKDFYAMYEEINWVPEIASKLRLIVSSGRSVIAVGGPDRGYVIEPDHGLVFASQDLMAHELLAYAWLKWSREQAPAQIPVANRPDLGNVRDLTKRRSEFNKQFVARTWYSQGGPEVQGIDLYQPGDIYDHPSIRNFMRHKGRPAKVNFVQLNKNPDAKVQDYLKKQIKAC